MPTSPDLDKYVASHAIALLRTSLPDTAMTLLISEESREGMLHESAPKIPCKAHGSVPYQLAVEYDARPLLCRSLC